MPAHFARRSLGVMALLCLVSSPTTTTASPVPSVDDQPILVIGASYADGRLPFNDSMQAPFGGAAVNFGGYLSLGDALVRVGKLVVNEAQAGATTFDRSMCLADVCLDVGWQGYSAQLHKAMSRVAIPNPAEPTQIMGYNAQYVYISMPNDCLHSGAAGVPMSQSAPCDEEQVDAFVDRMLAVGEDVIDMGLVPIYSRYPDSDDIDLSIQGAMTGLTWWVNDHQWNTIATTFESRVEDELPGAILVDAWRNMQTIDGLHPTPKSAQRAARRIRDAISEYEQGCSY